LPYGILPEIVLEGLGSKLIFALLFAGRFCGGH